MRIAFEFDPDDPADLVKLKKLIHHYELKDRLKTHEVDVSDIKAKIENGEFGPHAPPYGDNLPMRAKKDEIDPPKTRSGGNPSLGRSRGRTKGTKAPTVCACGATIEDRRTGQCNRCRGIAS
jgi:hypothetical protein